MTREGELGSVTQSRVPELGIIKTSAWHHAISDGRERTFGNAKDIKSQI
jgi:hypothetical protein